MAHVLGAKVMDAFHHRKWGEGLSSTTAPRWYDFWVFATAAMMAAPGSFTAVPEHSSFPWASLALKSISSHITQRIPTGPVPYVWPDTASCCLAARQLSAFCTPAKFRLTNCIRHFKPSYQQLPDLIALHQTTSTSVGLLQLTGSWKLLHFFSGG